MTVFVKSRLFSGHGLAKNFTRKYKGGYSLFIVLQYLDITYSNPASFSTFYCSTIHCPYSNLKFFSYTCFICHVSGQVKKRKIVVDEFILAILVHQQNRVHLSQ